MKTLDSLAFTLLLVVTSLSASHALADPDCENYVDEAKWSTEKVGGYFAGSYPSLHITLNRSGCTYTTADTEAIFNLIYAEHSQDPEWSSPKLSAEQMRDSVKFQLECQLGKSPVPDPITLEPRRQGVSLDAFKKMSNCNTP